MLWEASWCIHADSHTTYSVQISAPGSFACIFSVCWAMLLTQPVALDTQALAYCSDSSCLQASHINSMRELLYSHTLIKVQINQSDDEQVKDTCQQLASQSNAQLLQLKGRTALFMQADADLDTLRQSTSQARASTSHRKSQQQLERVWHNSDEAEGPIQLRPDVQSQLQFLTSAGVLMTDDLDKRSLR